MSNKSEDLDTAQLRAFQAARIESLMHKPALSDSEISEVIGLPHSSYLMLKRRLKIPQFKIGKRWFVRREDFLAWLASQAEAAKGPL
ncbi:MAG: helix-turn-helix domain-containing protein [Nitrospira sp.]|nr:helix-turn-helix domain-containing protein [Nitrospira sp.]